jgi:abhydrolase domain-containing protein 13
MSMLTEGNTSSSSVLSWVWLGTQLVGGLIITLSVVLYYNQDKMLYMPNPLGAPKTPDENPPGWQSPADWSITGQPNHGGGFPIPFEDHMIKTADNLGLHAWLLLHEGKSSVPTVIYFHGNAGNMGFRLKNAARMFAVAKVNVLMVDYRGYGEFFGRLCQ